MSAETIALARVKAGGEMTETHEVLLAIITQQGQTYLAELLGIGSTEIHRKIMGETGFTLRQIAMVFDAFGVRIAGPEQIVIDEKKYESLTRLASDALTAQVITFDRNKDRRKPT